MRRLLLSTKEVMFMNIQPNVFAVGNDYQIIVTCDKEALLWIKIGDKCFYDDINGVMRTETDDHRLTVPMELLDREKQYTVFYREMIDRKTYCPVSAEEQSETFEFHPLTSQNFRAYCIADAHYMFKIPISAFEAYGGADVLLMCGDTPNDLSLRENLRRFNELTFAMSKGQIPVLFARGNHDLRGRYAEYFHEYTPNVAGKTYYTFRMGPIWGIVLDCAEDKEDEHHEYAGTCNCYEFRRRQVDFIKDVISRSDEEYLAEGIQYKVVISHIPFSLALFGFEKELYEEWTSLLKDNVKPDLMISGHTHSQEIILPENDERVPCPLVITSDVSYGDDYYAGAGFEFSPEQITVTFTDRYEKILGITELPSA